MFSHFFLTCYLLSILPMFSVNRMPPPFLCNPLKHHLGFIKEYIEDKLKDGIQTDDLSIIKDLKHLGGSLMDVYSGSLKTEKIINEISDFLIENKLTDRDSFMIWAGKNPKDFKTMTLSDDSHWILKYSNNKQRYVHPFPSRYSRLSFRVKANTLKTAILYLIFVGKDYVTEDGLNLARAMCGLSPVKEVADAEAITEMIELLRV
jgi:hypothetical protein